MEENIKYPEEKNITEAFNRFHMTDFPKVELLGWWDNNGIRCGYFINICSEEKIEELESPLGTFNQCNFWGEALGYPYSIDGAIQNEDEEMVRTFLEDLCEVPYLMRLDWCE